MHRNARPICRPRCRRWSDLPQLVAAYGIAVPRAIACATREQAIAAAATIGFPVVLKGLVTGVTHKTELQAGEDSV